MKNIEIHWFEAKQLDRVTNFSTEVEVIKAAIENQKTFRYYCSFSGGKKYFGLKDSIRYLGVFRNRYIKFLEFNLLVSLKAIQLVLSKRDIVIMTNQNLILNVLPALFLNHFFRRKNKFLVDIRTTPVVPESFERDMKRFHFSFKYAVRYFDGFSFITPFMEKYLMKGYKVEKPVVHWSSGVNMDLFDYRNLKKSYTNKPFTIFYHGGISESRGNLNLIKACQKLISMGHSLQLVQIGICVDESISEYINDNNIHNWCKLLPVVPLKDIPQQVIKADLPVLPFPDFMAWRVSSPIKLMEYLALGKKVLAPNMEAFTDVFNGHENLVFYYSLQKEDQIAELTRRIEEIILSKSLEDFNPDKAIRFVRENYTWKIQANSLFDFCNTL